MTDVCKNSNNYVSTRTGLTFNQLNTVFPFHLRIDSRFIVTQVGSELGKHFSLNQETKKPVCIGRHIADIFHVISPILFKWDYKRLKIAQNINFKFDVKQGNSTSIMHLPLIGGVVLSDPNTDTDCTEQSALFLLSLRISDMQELLELNFTFGNLNRFAFQNELILANEHLDANIKLMNALEKTKASLEKERSKTLVSIQIF